MSDEIISGFPIENGKFEFRPKETATRAQAAAFISRMLTVIEKTPDVEEPPVKEEPPVNEEPRKHHLKNLKKSTIHIK